MAETDTPMRTLDNLEGKRRQKKRMVICSIPKDQARAFINDLKWIQSIR